MGIAILLWIFQPPPPLDSSLCCLHAGKDNKAVVSRRIFQDRGILKPVLEDNKDFSSLCSEPEGAGGARSNLISGERDAVQSKNICLEIPFSFYRNIQF